MSKIKVNKEEVVYEDRFVSFRKAHYTDKSGKSGVWAFIGRTGGTKAVVVLPLTAKRDEILLIKQFRVPVNHYVIEFPAGLIENNEDIGVSALRELKEETGYNGKLIEAVSPELVTSSGLGSELIHIAAVEIDETAGHQELEDTEDIEVLRLKVKGIKQQLLKYSNEGILVDSKVWALLGCLDFFL